MPETLDLDLKEILQLLWRRAWLIILVSVVGLAAAYFVSVYMISPTYTSAISLHVNNSPETSALGTINLADINAAQRLVNTYIVILRDDDVMEELGKRLLEEYEPEWLGMFLPISNVGGELQVSIGALRGMINMSSVNNTEVLRIQAVTGSPYLSARICTIMAEMAPAILMRVVGAGSVEIIGTARPAIVPSSPNIVMNSLIGFAACLVLVVGVILLIHFLDNRVKDENGITKRFDIPILGEIPDFRATPKKGYTYYGN